MNIIGIKAEAYMNKRAWAALSAVAVFLLIIFVGAKAQAWTEFRSGNRGTVAAGETVDSTLIIGAKSVDIAGTVNGDVICGAQTVNINGTVKGDVICGAQTVNISGTVEGSIRIGAQSVNLTGSVAHNATIGAQSVTTDSKSRIGGDASIGATDTTLNGIIGRDLAVAGNSATIRGEIARDIKSAANKLVLGQKAKVGGGIEYTSRDKIDIAEGAEVSGKITQDIPKDRDPTFPTVFVFQGITALIAALLLLVTALIVTALFPKMVHSVSNQGMKRPWWVLLTGFVASFIAPVLMIMLAITIVGIPLAILLFFGWTLIALSSGLFTAYYVGRMVWRGQNNSLLRILAGSLILLVLFMVPYLGLFVMLATFWIGAGMVLLELKDRTPKPKYNLK